MNHLGPPAPGFYSVRFSVLDVETTGIFPTRHDRIVEVAVVVVEADGRIQDEYSSLVNPNRDVGPTRVHGIAASDVASAPSFQTIAGDVLDRLRGTIVVGHNVRFDASFVRAECERSGLALPAFPTLCTLGLVSTLGLSVASRKLVDCCEAVGVGLHGAHSALGDARATAGLLTACLRVASDDGLTSFAELGCAPGDLNSKWPLLTRSGKALSRGAARQITVSEGQFLARVVSALPHDSTLSGNAASYLHALDRALSDRLVTAEEADELLTLARSYGLSRHDVDALHRRYYAMLHRTAMADGRITDMEQGDLESCARLLGVEAGGPGPEAAGSQVAAGHREQHEAHLQVPALGLGSADLAGKSVCFTGESLLALEGRRSPEGKQKSLLATPAL